MSGRIWFEALAGTARVSGSATVRVADAGLGDELARFIAVVPDANNRFPRARHGEVGLEEAWTIAKAVRELLCEHGATTGANTPSGAAATQGSLAPRVRARPIVAVVDVTSQAYGSREELLGIHLACAAASDAYASARWSGHPVIALLVGKAMSGAFLAHGYQANRIVALDSPNVMVHAMGKQAAARVTRRPVEELEELGERFAPMSYTVRAFAALGLVHKLVTDVSAESPTAADVERVRGDLIEAVIDARRGERDLSSRLANAAAARTRAASLEVRRRLAERWDV